MWTIIWEPDGEVSHGNSSVASKPLAAGFSPHCIWLTPSVWVPQLISQIHPQRWPAILYTALLQWCPLHPMPYPCLRAVRFFRHFCISRDSGAGNVIPLASAPAQLCRKRWILRHRPNGSQACTKWIISFETSWCRPAGSFLSVSLII